MNDPLWVPGTNFPRNGEPWVGEQVPRVWSAPEWSVTAGDDAIDLAEAAGLDLLPWQKFVLRNALGEDGVRFAAFEVCLLVPRQNGKNVVLLALILAALFLFGHEQVIFSAHKFKTAKSTFRDLKKLLTSNPSLLAEVRRIGDSSNDASIELLNGCRIDFFARQGGNSRGFSGDLVILDEAFQLDPVLLSDFLPTLSAKPAPQVWYTSSAGFDYSEALKEIYVRGTEKREENPKLALFSWESDPDTPWDSLEAVIQSNPSLGYLQTWEWIQNVDLKSMTEESYRRERLGLWKDDSSGAVIGVDLWGRTAASQEALLGSRVVRRSLALEVTVNRDMSFIGGAALLRDGRVVVDLVAARKGVAWLQDELKRLSKAHKPHAGVVIDQFSGGAALGPRLAENGIPVSFASTRDLTEGSLEFFDGLAREDDGDPDPWVLHGSHPLLDDAAHTARKRLVGSSRTAWTWQAFGEVEVEPLRAVTLAMRGLFMDPIKKSRGRVA